MRPPEPAWDLDDATDDGSEEAAHQLGPWAIGDLLGRGGAGVVYSATHVTTGEPAAVKVLTSVGQLSDTQRRRFERELSVQRSIQDDDVVRILDSGTAVSGEQWVAMERLDGRSLMDRIAASEPLEFREIAVLVRTVALALHRLHDRGIVHRDVKPGNILLTRQGAPRLADFGLVVLEEATASLTRTGANPGTPRYMAPEQKAGVVERWPLVDVYALGLVLDELLENWRVGAWSMSLSSRSDGVPLDLKWIAHRAIDPDPDLRTRSCKALAADLTRWLEGHSVRRRPEVLLARATRFAWRQRVPLAIVGVAVVGMMTIAVPMGLDRLAEQRANAAAAHRWDRLRLSWAGGLDADAFDRFVEDPELHGRPVLADAWTWRAERTDARDRGPLAARAVRLARTDAQRTHALSLLSDSYLTTGDWDRLSALDAHVPPDAERTRWLSMVRDPTGASPVLKSFQTAAHAPFDGTGHTLSVPLAPPSTTPLTHTRQAVEGSQWAGRAGMWVDGDKLWGIAPEDVDPGLTLDRVPADVAFTTGGDRLFYVVNDQRSILMEALPGEDQPVVPEVELLQSYGQTLVAGDVDGDGLDELIVTVGQPHGYGVVLVELDARGDATGHSVHRMGAVYWSGILQTAVGPRLVTTAHSAHRSPALFDHGIGGDGPARVLVHAVRDGLLELDQEVVLPPFVEEARIGLPADIDGNGTEELLVEISSRSLTGGQYFGKATFVFEQDAAGRLRESHYLEGIVIGGAAQLDDDPELELFGLCRGFDSPWAVFGLGEETPAPVGTAAPSSAAPLLARLGQYEEAALDAESLGDFAAAADWWEDAGDLTAASLAAETAGDLARAGELAARDLDFDRARQLGLDDPRLPGATPATTLDFSHTLPPSVWTHPDAVHQDLHAGTLVIDGVAGAGTVLEWPLEVVGKDVLVDISTTQTWGEWAAGLMVQLVDERGEVFAWAGTRVIGSGGLNRRQAHTFDGSRDWAAATLFQVDPIHLQLSAFGTGVARGADRVVHGTDRSLTLNRGDKVTLRIVAQGAPGHRVGWTLDGLSVWGLVPSGEEVDPEGGLHPVAAARLVPERATHADVARLWASVAASHPDHPELDDAVRELDLDDPALDADTAARIAVAQADQAFRRGDLDGVHTRLAEAIARSAAPAQWSQLRRAHHLAARVALAEDDVDRALEHARAALAAAPDPDLGRRLLATTPELLELVR